MELEKALKMALNLMDQHGLIEKGWNFAFDNAERRLGLCDFGIKRLSISRYFTGAATEEQVEKAILHEIAHALVGSKVQAHGAEWKSKAIAIGHSGERTSPNPYAAAQRAAKQAAMAKSAPNGEIPPVGIGTVVVYQDREYVVFKKATKKWHADNKEEGRRLFLPFDIAHLYVKL